ncbi:FAD-dependent oxidoreductase [Aerococcus mictus]|uniref:FAD-dependent oxidoreductase n=1 Tax=Aerococcus mictus TaxID=2976810 RepID=UPI0012457CA0|nr:FAD-dependent oxidoreductase [Aerococcus mictus]KAA9290055.1 FAD-dependent oxidoreductase [Aerococcus mictus]
METKVVSDQGEAINETYDTDILVVGGGISGLAAAVEAGHQEGVEVLLVESNAYCGGNGMGVEGMLGVDSVMQKEADIHLDPVELIGYEHQQV